MAFTDWFSVPRSSHVSSVRFDPETGTLQVEYKNGSVYEWYGAQQEQANGILSAESPGKYINANVTGLLGPGQKV